MAADPRDSGPAMEPPASTSSFSPALRHLHSSSSSTSSSRHRLPQSQFSFEYHLPLRKRALTASAQQYSSSPAAAAAAANHPAPRRTISTSSTTAPVHVPTHRRSVPNFSLPHVAALSRQSSFSSPLSTLNQNSLHSPRPREVESPGDDTLNPNASKRRRQSAVIFQDPAKNTMPASTQTYVPYRPSFAADKSRALNGVDKQAQDPDETITSNTSREDIFLNIARSDSDHRNSLARSEFRRVCRKSPRKEKKFESLTRIAKHSPDSVFQVAPCDPQPLVYIATTTLLLPNNYDPAIRMRPCVLLSMPPTVPCRTRILQHPLIPSMTIPARAMPLLVPVLDPPSVCHEAD